MKRYREDQNPLVIYDGQCLLCSKAIHFILKYEKNNLLNFTTLDSEFGRDLVKEGFQKQVPDSILFYKDGKLMAESNATFSILSYLSMPLSFIRIFRFLPRSLSDLIYRWVARNRYNWFGKTEEKCWIMTPHHAHRFK